MYHDCGQAFDLAGGDGGPGLLGMTLTPRDLDAPAFVYQGRASTNCPRCSRRITGLLSRRFYEVELDAGRAGRSPHEAAVPALF